ncbi:hypothetical protein GMST_04860 [Geomonas silvestris]|uniref:Uncharacterized protein n=1 Tax=Geomonas silvestris TaxID=2740184 RepID=A0A6V8MDU6_9BACT|nr:hypothetical protein [Geomonas silvestris]GFO58161.1 hypothetical protein GMST_04860 [Geomonas silvestris]
MHHSRHFKSRSFLLPLIVALTVFFVAQGINLPAWSGASDLTSGPSLVAKHAESAAVFKTSHKSAHFKLGKASTSFLIPVAPPCADSRFLLVRGAGLRNDSFRSISLASLPARAPPA